MRPHVQVVGPEDGERRPAVLLFHGCGGLRAHLPNYAQAAAMAGIRAFIIDSYAPRGWSPTYARLLVCTGARFWGRERAGDVLAAVAGVVRRSDVDASRICLAGWSHGGWAIMDLMTMPLRASGEAGLVDPDPAALSGVRSLWLSYPYGGFGALSHDRPWLRSPRVYGVVAGRDHVTRASAARRLYDAPRRTGARVDVWEIPSATHSYDEPTGVPPMQHSSALLTQSVVRFRTFLIDTLAPSRHSAASSSTPAGQETPVPPMPQ